MDDFDRSKDAIGVSVRRGCFRVDGRRPGRAGIPFSDRRGRGPGRQDAVRFRSHGPLCDRGRCQRRQARGRDIAARRTDGTDAVGRRQDALRGRAASQRRGRDRHGSGRGRETHFGRGVGRLRWSRRRVASGCTRATGATTACRWSIWKREKKPGGSAWCASPMPPP